MSWQHCKLSLHYRLSQCNTRAHQQFSTLCETYHDNTMPSMLWQHPKLSLHYRLPQSYTHTHQQFSILCQACRNNTLNYDCTIDYDSPTLTPTLLKTKPNMSWQHPKLWLHNRLSQSHNHTHQQFSTLREIYHYNTLSYDCTIDYDSPTLAHTNSSQHYVKYTMTTP